MAAHRPPPALPGKARAAAGRGDRLSGRVKGGVLPLAPALFPCPQPVKILPAAIKFLQLRPAGYCYGIPTPEQRRQKKRQYQEPSLHNHPPIQPRPTVSKPSDRPRCSGFTYRCSIRRNSGKIHPENLPRRSPRNYSRRIKKISAKKTPLPVPSSAKTNTSLNKTPKMEKQFFAQ